MKHELVDHQHSPDSEFYTLIVRSTPGYLGKIVGMEMKVARYYGNEMGWSDLDTTERQTGSLERALQQFYLQVKNGK